MLMKATMNLFQQNDHAWIHYYPNTMHYTEKDAEIWIPEIKFSGCRVARIN
jgi:hypothetical protein